MTTFQRPRVLRNLRIDDVSSVDRGAGRGVRVLLTKRSEEEDQDMSTPETIAKATTVTIETLAAELQAKHGMTWGEAVQKAIVSPEVSRLVKAEKASKGLYDPGADRRRGGLPVRDARDAAELSVEEANQHIQMAADAARKANPTMTREQAYAHAFEKAPEPLRARAKGHMIVHAGG
jgi:hypothetical protein